MLIPGVSGRAAGHIEDEPESESHNFETPFGYIYIYNIYIRLRTQLGARNPKKKSLKAETRIQSTSRRTCN